MVIFCIGLLQFARLKFSRIARWLFLISGKEWMQERNMIESSCILALQNIDSFKLYIITWNQGLLELNVSLQNRMEPSTQVLQAATLISKALENTLLGCSLVYCLQASVKCLMHSVFSAGRSPGLGGKSYHQSHFYRVDMMHWFLTIYPHNLRERHGSKSTP